MKKGFLLFGMIFALLMTSSAVYSAGGPACTQDGMWKYVVSNAYRMAENYALENNPSSTFMCIDKNYSFVKQSGGKYEGKYLLLIRNKHGRDTSFAALLPLFDVNQSSNDLDDSSLLWKVVMAKYNGRKY